MRHVPARFLWALLLPTICPLAADAAFIPWKYNWSRNPPIIYSDTSNTTYLTLTDEQLRTAAGSSDIVATNIRTFSDAPPGFPAQFTNKGYTLTLFLLDVESNKSGTLAFSGLFNGTVSSLSSEITNTFTAPTTQTLFLGNNRYDVTLPYFTPPGPPGSDNAGSISAHATVRITEIHKTPEPSTLLLASLGSAALGWRAWRRRSPLAA